MYTEQEFGNRLAALRMKKGVSARDMSLALGQNHGYINNIENGKNFPAMTMFFYICEYLSITPSEFFELENSDPSRLSALCMKLKALDDEQLKVVESVVDHMG